MGNRVFAFKKKEDVLSSSIQSKRAGVYVCQWHWSSVTAISVVTSGKIAHEMCTF